MLVFHCSYAPMVGVGSTPHLWLYNSNMPEPLIGLPVPLPMLFILTQFLVSIFPRRYDGKKVDLQVSQDRMTK